MIRNNLILNLHHELFVDGFAGGGGASTGIELAIRRHVDHAMNHDAKALGMHRINHPQTIHHCEDIFDVNPRVVTEGRPVGAGWFSPDCKHFSKAKGGHFGLAAASLIHVAQGDADKNGKKRGRGEKSITEPMPAVLASNDCAVVAANLVKLRGDVESHGNAPGLKEPLHTVSADGLHHGIVAAHMIQKGHYKSNSQMTKGADEPMRCQVSRAEHGIVAANLIKFRGDSEGAAMDNPSPTVTAGSVKKRVGGNGHAMGLSAAFMAQSNGGFNRTPHNPVTKPCSTITSAGSQQQLVAANLVKYYGNDKDGQGLDEPGHTVTTKERFALIQIEASRHGLTVEQFQGAVRVAKFLREYGVTFEGEFAMVGGFVIYDLGMRMLIARELFRAQGFSDSYIIDHAWLVNPKTGEIKVVKLTKTEQIRMCGNSVCPPIAEALVRSNSGDLCIESVHRWTTIKKPWQLVPA